MSEYGPVAPSPLDRIAQDAAAAAAHSAEAVQLGQQSYNRDVVIGHAIGATHEAVQAGRSANLQGFADTAAGIGEVRADVAGVDARVGELGSAITAGNDETHRLLSGIGTTVETGNNETHRLLGGVGSSVEALTTGFQERWAREDQERADREAKELLARQQMEAALRAREKAMTTARWAASQTPEDRRALGLRAPQAKPKAPTPPPPSGFRAGMRRLMPSAVGGRMVAWGGRRGGVIGALSRGAGHTIRGGAGAITGTFNWLRSQTGITDPAGRTGPRRVHLLGRRQRGYPYN